MQNHLSQALLEVNTMQDMLKKIERGQLPIKICLIGSSDGEIVHNNFSETGRYTLEELPRIAAEQEIDIFFVSSVWPECKGLKDFVRLSEMLPDDYRIVLVGLTKEQIIQKLIESNQISSGEDVILNSLYFDAINPTNQYEYELILKDGTIINGIIKVEDNSEYEKPIKENSKNNLPIL